MRSTILSLPRLFALLLVLASSAVAQTDPAQLAARLDSTLDAVLARTGVMGATAAIISPRYGTWTGVAGMSSAADGEAVSPDMLFGIGSITKTFTTATILQLASEGQFALDDTIGRWISGLPNISGRITVRQLLAHTSGLYNYTDSPDFWQFTTSDLDRFITPEDALQFVGPPSFTPGFGWSYTNTGFALLGVIIERVTGRPYEEEIARRLTGPLGLGSITMGYNDSLPGTLAGNWANLDGAGDLDDWRGLPRRAIYSGAWAAGGLVSNARDLASWGNALYGGDILTPEMMTQMTTFRSIAGLGPSGGYGLGISRKKVAGRIAIGHGGDIPAFSSILWFFPGDSITVAVIVNQNHDAPEIIAEALAAAMFQSASAPNELSAMVATAATPNPFTGSTRLAFTAERRGHASVRVYNMIGTPVRTLVDGTIESGAHTIAWDGRDDAGAELPSGAYVMRVEGSDASSARIVVKQ
jgi:D-alanyl-D-alanine carboxypeptidase